LSVCVFVCEVLAIFAVIPPPSRLAHYLTEKWANIEKYLSNVRSSAILTAANNERDDDDLIEALCRMRGIMLLVHPLNTGAPIRIYGQSRLVLEAAEWNGTYAALNHQTNIESGPSAAKKQKTLTQQSPADFSHVSESNEKHSINILMTHFESLAQNFECNCAT
uniref:BK_channel_a domain-containing protein n=1 Tax=Anisakis simplex TaxID=6269 RepID=A0A0M3J858_ANISI